MHGGFHLTPGSIGEKQIGFDLVNDDQILPFLVAVSTHPPPSILGGGFVGSGQGDEDRLEGGCALEPCGVDGRAHVRLGLCGPQEHQLNQLVLAQPLQITAIHAHLDSEIGDRGKGAL